MRPEDLDELARNIREASGITMNYDCVAVWFGRGRWICATNQIVLNRTTVVQQIRSYCDRKKWILANPRNGVPVYIVRGKDNAYGATHAEMAIVSVISNGYTISPPGPATFQIPKFPNTAMGVSKEVCEKCAVILSEMEIGYGTIHSRKTQQDGWDFPYESFEERFPSLNDGTHAFGSDSEDSDYVE